MLGPSMDGLCNLRDHSTDTLVYQVLEELDGLVVRQVQLETLLNLEREKNNDRKKS